VSLQDRIARLIAATGPISVADYIASANAHYYATRDPLGAAGDFTTAPEISQMFGELIGLALADVWHRAGCPADAAYVELGPGRGTLARDALAAMRKAGLNPSVHLVETSPALRAKQSALIAHAVHHDGASTLPTDAPLLIIANEFFDALPIRQFIRTEKGWREMMVTLDSDALAPRPGTTPHDETVPLPLRDAPVGSMFESCPAASAIMADLAARLAVQGGAMLTIDYGHTGPALGDTLQAVRGHAFANPFVATGEADLTAHVDFTPLTEAARAAGLAVLPLATQGHWLTQLGIDARCTALSAHHPARAAELREQRDRLVNAEEMGHLFKMLAIHHPSWPAPAGIVP
jgi:NADH dehydrogenase [ubiquinone] 1 alpha subcomplex assembly factor 7